jgi:hypothetical protein
MIHPDASGAPPVNPDLTEEIQSDYQEASGIVARSPRGAAAILRLCVQKLCQQLDLPGKDLNKDIGQLVKRGLNPQVQQALDIVRVIGNNAVHPGQIDLRDDRATALRLCALLNLIADAMISQPKQVRELYESLPEGQRDAIERRDSKK